MSEATDEFERQQKEQRHLERREREGQERRTWRTEDRVVERTNTNVADVHAGLWGSGDQLRGRLHRYGYDADEVATAVAQYDKSL